MIKLHLEYLVVSFLRFTTLLLVSFEFNVFEYLIKDLILIPTSIKDDAISWVFGSVLDCTSEYDFDSNVS
jgi:hypothetical protein